MLKVATLSDVEGIVRLLKSFHSESPYSNDEFNSDYVQLVVIDVINNPHKSTILLAETEEGEKIGILGATLSPLLMSGTNLATEMVWWVHPDFRSKSSVAQDLLQSFEYWAKLMNCSKMSLALLDGPYARILDRFYKQRGYRFVESSYVKEL